MRRRYQYQLVLQFPASSLKDYDALIELEDGLIAGIGNFGKVDGHDMGSGKMNIFIHSDHPKLAFQWVEQLIGTQDFMLELKAAYREADGEKYTILHPAGLEQFQVK